MHKQTLREAVRTAGARMAHFLPLLPNESHKEREASIFQRSHQPGCSISLWWGSSEVFLFFLPGRHSDHMWTQEARELDRQDAESLIVERLPFSDSTKSACLNYLAELKKKNVFLNCCSSGCITSSSAAVSIQSKQPDADGLWFPEGLGYVRLVPHTEAGQTSPNEP